jgi:5-methylcytosine-specific restriction endonuclease McrA
MLRIDIEPELVWALYWGLDYNQEEIGRIFKCSYSPVSRIMKDNGIPIKEKYGENNSFYGKKHVHESLLKQRESKLGGKNSMFGKHITDEHKELLSKLKKGVPRPDIVGDKNPAWNGGYEPYYGPNWKEQRRKALKRDRNTCQECGATETDKEHDVHHIIPFRKFGREGSTSPSTLSKSIDPKIVEALKAKKDQSSGGLDRSSISGYLSIITSISAIDVENKLIPELISSGILRVVGNKIFIQ